MAKPKKNTQAWAITYADMVTLLLTFFVLLFKTGYDNIWSVVKNRRT